MKERLEKFVNVANNYGGCEYGFNCLIKSWSGDKAVVTLEDQDDRESPQNEVMLSCDGKTFLVEDMEGKLLATTNYPKVLFTILYA